MDANTGFAKTGDLKHHTISYDGASGDRRYQRTAQTMILGSKCRHLNNAGRGLIMECSLSDSFIESLQHSHFDQTGFSTVLYRYAAKSCLNNGCSSARQGGICIL